MVSDDVGQITSNVSDSVGQRPPQTQDMADNVGQEVRQGERDVGHDIDLPEREERHVLTTYEVGKMFEEAECRVSERTIIRWCNRNRLGNRRLDCAFDPSERKYYIAEESVKQVIREEMSKGRQSEMYTPDLSDITQEMSDDDVGQTQHVVGQRPTPSNIDVRQEEHVADSVGRASDTPSASVPVMEVKTHDVEAIKEEVMTLKIELAKLEEQAKTKDEMMTYLRKEIDRRGEQIVQDRDVYQQSLVWFREQLERKDLAIEHLNVEVRGLLEAPRRRDVGQGSDNAEMPHTVFGRPDEQDGRGAQL